MNVFGFLVASWWALVIAILIAFIAFMAAIMLTGDDRGFKVVYVIAPVLTFVLVFLLIAGINSYTTIQKGTVGLVTRYGGLTSEVMKPGLNWKYPFIERVEVVDTTQQTYEMSEYPDTSKADWVDYPISSNTSDGQIISITATTIFRIPDAEAAVNIRQNIGNIEEVVENVVKANSRSWGRTLAKSYPADVLYSGKVTELQNDIRDKLVEKFAEQGYGLVLVDFLIRSIGFSPEYVDAIENKQIAEENVITEQNNAEKAKWLAQQEIEQKRGEALGRLELAKADAEAVKLSADAEAYAIEQRGTALKRYPDILQLNFVEQLSDNWGFLPSDSIEWLLPVPEGGTK